MCITTITICTVLFLSTLSLRRATPAGAVFSLFYPQFLSTLSLRRATARRESRQQPAGISIHALLAESDSAPRITPTASRNFYPRSPCGERRRGAVICYLDNIISIHALLAESDRQFPSQSPEKSGFLSTLSLRRATRRSTRHRLAHQFLSTLSLRRATTRRTCQPNAKRISIHALLAESDV